MINKKRLLSVAAAAALSASVLGADYLPLTSTATENKWVMFGVTGFHVDGAALASGGTEAGMFTIADDSDNVATDTGGDELYGEEGAVPTGEAIMDGANVLASVKRVDGTASAVEVRVDVSSINYYESDPVRTIYVKQDPDAATPLFAFTYKSALEGERLEFSTTSSGATDDAYFIIINSENTYNNPAIATYVPAVPPSGAEDGVYLTSVADTIDYDFADGPQAPNPIKSADYLKVDHQDTAAAGEYTRLYAYDPSGIWKLYDSRNTFQDFDTLEKGKGYWGRMDLAAATPAGFVLGSPSITTQDYIDSGIAEGWNLLAFNADNADLRVATTGLVVQLTGAGTMTLKDVSGNHSVTLIPVTAVAEDTAREINQAIKVAKIEGLIPNTFNIVAIPTAADTIALLSDEKFTVLESGAGILGSPTTLAGGTPLNATTLEDHAALADLTANGAMSKYGEYALIVKPENAAFAELDIKCDSLATELVAPTSAAIGGATCIDAAYDLDTDYDGTADNHILMVADEPFEIRDHTFSRVFDYTAGAVAGELTFVNDDAAITSDTAVVPASQVAVYTLDLAAAATDDATDIIRFNNGAADTDVVSGGVLNAAAIYALILGLGTITIDGVVYDITDGGGTTVIFTAQTAVAEADAMTVTVVDGSGGVTTGGEANPTGSPFAITTPGLASLTAQQVVTNIVGQGIGFVDGAHIDVVDTTKILFRMKKADTNEFRVLETGVADNLTPSSTTSTLAQGAISDVFSPNAFVKAALTNTITIALTDNVDPIETDTVSVTVVTPLVATIILDPYALDADDEADANVFYPKLAAHINEQLEENALDTTVAIAKTNATADDFNAVVTFTGSDVVNVTAFDFLAGDVTDGVPTITLGTPTIGDGDITEDLKYNFALAPNYVLDGPLYEMKAAGYTALAMVTGTMNLAGSTMNWDAIDLTRKPSEWLDSQDYNLFTVDDAAGYWTYLEAADANPLSFSAAPFSGNYTQHFDADGTTYNQVGGGLEITVNGISDYDDRKSARIVAVVGGSQVELSRDGTSDVYTGQISSYELKEMTAGREYDIQVIVADGLGYRIPATATGSVVDFKKPATPSVVSNGSTVAITNDAADGVEKYYLFSGTIPAQNTEAAAIATITAAQAASYNLCTATNFSRTGSYDLKFVAVDGDTLATANASDVYAIDDFAPMFKNSAIITNTMDTTPTQSIADVYYGSSCAVSTPAYSLESMQASSRTNTKTVKVSYEPKAVGTGAPITVFVDGGSQTSTTASITYNEDYVGDVVFVQLGESVFRYTLPNAATAIASTEGSPIDISAGYLAGQSLGE